MGELFYVLKSISDKPCERQHLEVCLTGKSKGSSYENMCFIEKRMHSLDKYNSDIEKVFFLAFISSY